MKGMIIGALALLTINARAQDMHDPKATVTGLFIATDQRDWEQVEALFSQEVLLDYSSMNGVPAATLPSEQIISAWQSILPGFEHTHHQLGNFTYTMNDTKASVFCYGTASHYLGDENGPLWVVVGTYDFELEKHAEGAWKISSMKFNFKYQDGNTALPEKAINNLK